MESAQFGSLVFFLTCLFSISACTVVADVGTVNPIPVAATKVSTSEPATANHYRPPVAVNWQLQLQGVANTAHDADLYVVDLFDTPVSTISGLQKRGVAVICYFSAGTHEKWRSDANEFSASDLGDPLEDWPGERWLDVRSRNVRRIMATRLDMALAKGCDGVDPDNVDGYSNQTGIELMRNDQLSYNRYLAGQAHARGLAIGLKNSVGLAGQLIDDYDFTVNESCDRHDECDELDIFIRQGKPVLHVEYRPEFRLRPKVFTKFCRHFQDKRFSTLVLPRDLDDDYRLSCQ
ncbi:endo alpha-1,4 polygalactosaminidase [Granulosicoccus sp. 3-233]|uniref:endo alpha-1,4 polygalactosaminidase n=1 Tax=Granulosicoccus sp. 3-233 TaxID=3417969 RepID=UPI003D34A3A4